MGISGRKMIPLCLVFGVRRCAALRAEVNAQQYPAIKSIMPLMGDTCAV